MNQYERISQMEAILDRHQALLDQLGPLMDAFIKSQKEYRRLYRYYGSEQFMKDCQAPDRPSFPKELKYGVLSEDAVFNLLGDNRQMALLMIETGLRILKNE